MTSCGVASQWWHTWRWHWVAKVTRLPTRLLHVAGTVDITGRLVQPKAMPLAASSEQCQDVWLVAQA